MSKNDNLGEKINTPTKKCKYCRKEIAIDAKVCTNCWRKQNSIGKYIVIGILLLIFVFGIILLIVKNFKNLFLLQVDI